MSTPIQPLALDPTAAAPRNWLSRRVAGLLVGLLLLVSSLALICAGAFAALAGSGGTYVDLGAHGSYSTHRYVLATTSTNWRTQLLGWAGSVRLEVASTGQKPIFVGVGAADTIGRYLSRTAYTAVGEHARTEHDGGAPELSPATAVAWTAHAEGTGTQTLTWNASNRPQIVLAMNADGSRPVRVRIVSSAVTLDRMPWWVPAGALASGLILLAIGVAMLRRTIRARGAVA
jgi:hypothetical protein